MTPPDGLEPRIARLEQYVARLQEEIAIASSDSSAARTLASGADRDVSEVRAELRAHLSVLNALRRTQVEQGELLAEQGEVLAAHSEVLAEHSEVLAEHSLMLEELRQDVRTVAASQASGFASVHAGMSHIVELLTPRDPRQA